MKAQLITLAAVVLLSTNVAAQEDDEAKSLIDEKCGIVKSIAETVMTSRQEDHPLSLVVAEMSRRGIGDEIRSVVLDAYREPVQEDEASKQQVISAFADNAEHECYHTQVEKRCEQWASLAETAMGANQKDVPRQAILNVFSKLGDHGVALVRRAYSEPFWTTQSKKQQAIREFVANETTTCYRVYGVEK